MKIALITLQNHLHFDQKPPENRLHFDHNFCILHFGFRPMLLILKGNHPNSKCKMQLCEIPLHFENHQSNQRVSLLSTLYCSLLSLSEIDREYPLTRYISLSQKHLHFSCNGQRKEVERGVNDIHQTRQRGGAQ